MGGGDSFMHTHNIYYYGVTLVHKLSDGLLFQFCLVSTHIAIDKNVSPVKISIISPLRWKKVLAEGLLAKRVYKLQS